MSFPVLRFADGVVRPFEQRHLTPRYVSWLNDPEVVRYSEQRHRTHTLDSCQAYFDSFAGSPDHFLAIEADRHGHVGNIGISVDVSNAVADVSIIVGEKAVWGTGIASQAWCAVIDMLLKGRSVRKVTAGTMSVNEPMLRLMARSGMVVEAIRKRQALWEGKEVDMVYAAAFARDWQADGRQPSFPDGSGVGL